MPEWLVEQGIGETRAALVDRGAIVEARIELDDSIPAGTILSARLAAVGRDKRNAIAIDDEGREYLVPLLPSETTEGAKIAIEVTREAIPGPEPWKKPMARWSADPLRAQQSLVERLGTTGIPVRELVFPSARDELEAAGWGAVLEQATSGVVQFAGGKLGIFPTPAMTLVDVDGYLRPQELAVAGAVAAAQAIRRLDIGGSIGIDLPTTPGKALRQSIGSEIDRHVPQPFERTAVNGFGFVQVVRPRTRPSLIEICGDRAAAEARALLRKAAFERTGASTLVAHPAVIAVLEHRQSWLDMLARHVGGIVDLRPDPSLPMHGSYAQAC